MQFKKTPGAWTRELRCELAHKLYGLPPRNFALNYRKQKNVAFLQFLDVAGKGLRS
jgi:hypothetical protein